MGCGTGTLLAKIVREGGNQRLTGLDVSPAMLATAREKLGRTAGWVAGDAVRLPFRSASFDLALSLSALHHWPQPVEALHEIRRVLRPGGRVAITAWCGDTWVMRARDRARRLVDPTHVRVHRTAELTELLAAAGYGWIRVERWRLSWSWEIMTGVAATPSAGR